MLGNKDAAPVLARLAAPATDQPRDAPADHAGGPPLGREAQMAAVIALGRLRDERLVSLSQEHGVVGGPLEVGSCVRILPNHSCLTNACFDHVHAVRGEAVVGVWRVRRER